MVRFSEPLNQTEHDSWFVGCFGFIGPLRLYFSLYRAVSQRERERERGREREREGERERERESKEK